MGGGGLDTLVSLIRVCSALLVTVPISDMETAIRSSVRCSKAATDFWMFWLVVRSWDSTNLMMVLSLVMVAELFWWNSLPRVIVYVSSLMGLAI